MQKVCVIFGGASSEHEVSLRSATCVIENINPKKYQIAMVGITKQGGWYHYTGPIDLISTGEWEKSPFIEPCLISPDPREGGIILLEGELFPSEKVRREIIGKNDFEEVQAIKKVSGLRVLPVDVVFPVLHGKNGEDGTIQGLLDMAEIPYVGCGVLSSAACMDKEVMHVMLENAGVPKTKLVAVRRDDMKDFVQLTEYLEKEIEYPMFIKPANAGSSVGISKVKTQQELLPAFELAFQHDYKVVVEKMIYGREIECAVYGTSNPVASRALGEIIPKRDFYDYDGKYLDDSVELIAPANVDKDQAKAIRETALKAYDVMHCAGLSRIDFFLKEDGSHILNEINTLPGFTSISMFPRLFNLDGLTITQLVDKLIESAFELD